MRANPEETRVVSAAFCLSVLLGAGTTLVGGCRPGVAPAASSPAPTAPQPAVAPVVSVNAVMVDLIDPAGHALWDAEREGHAPKTDADWQALGRHATQMAVSGPLIAIGGSGASDAVWSAQANWNTMSRELRDAGVAAAGAIKAKNLEALVTANGNLADVCERCHKEYKPSVPTEGLTHTPSAEQPRVK